jgi:hypothetical protein
VCNTIPNAAHEACQDLDLYSLCGFNEEQLRIDMQLVDLSYYDNLYHNNKHGADVVKKAASTLKRDKASLRKRIREAMSLKASEWTEEHEWHFALFQLAVLVAAAVHDSWHPGECCCCSLQEGIIVIVTYSRHKAGKELHMCRKDGSVCM